MSTVKSSPESRALTERQLFLETFLPSELLNSLSIQLPNVDKNYTLGLQEICSAAYYGLDFFESDPKKFKKYVKKSNSTEHMKNELAEAKSDLVA
jgi:hypothetical protein